MAINLKTNTVLKTIRLKAPGLPQDMAITLNGKTVYVLSAPAPTACGTGAWAGRGDADQHGHRPGRPPDPAAGATHSRFSSPRTARPLMCSTAGTGLVPIDLSTRQPLPEIKVRGASREAMLPSGKTIYVNASDGIVPVDLSTGTPLKPIVSSTSMMLGLGPVISPNGARLYDITSIGAHHTWGLLAVNTATNTALKPVKNFVGLQLAFGAGGATVYVAGFNSVLPIATATNKPLKQIRLPSSGASYGIASSPDESTVYAANQNATGSKSWVVPINAATARGTPISLGPSWGPFIIAVAPDGSVCVGSNRGSPHRTVGTVAVIPPGSGTVSKVIRIDGAPLQIVVTP